MSEAEVSRRVRAKHAEEFRYFGTIWPVGAIWNSSDEVDHLRPRRGWFARLLHR